MKYGSSYPDRFASRAAAETWVATFITWYHTQHRHSGIGLLMPDMLHTGQATAVTTARQQTLDQSYAVHPERFVGGPPAAPRVPDAAWINPPVDECSAAVAPAAPMPTGGRGSRVSAAKAAP
jgi:putative transposase